MRIFLSLLFLPLAFAAPEGLFPEKLTCETKGQIRFIYKGKMEVQPASYCFSEDRSYFLSPACREQKCAALQADLAGIQDLALTGKVGSPGFKLCRRAGGEAELLDFFDGKKWWSMDRCRFPADDSFVDTGILLRLWGKKRGR